MRRVPVGRWLLVAAAVVVAGTVAAAIAVMGTPQAQRQARQDERRVHDLDRITDVVRADFRRQGRLPAELSALATRPGVRLAVADPFTGTPYDYRVVDARQFQLCATFLTDTAANEAGGRRWLDRQWPHPAGRHCFDLAAKAD